MRALFRPKLIALLALVAVLFAVPWSPLRPTALFAQATLNQTTLSAAVTLSDNTITVASASTIAVADVIVIDRESMTVTAVNSTRISVNRGQNGTTAATHGSGAVVWTGIPKRFSQSEVSGSCTATSEVALPRVVIPSGNIYNCSVGYWQRYANGGLPAFGVGLLSGGGQSGMTYTALGAITITPGVVFINGTTLAMTLANPTTAQNGLIMTIISTNASAQTVTYTAGFNGGTTTRDVATYGGAVGDNMVIFANNGVWWVISSRNVTFG